MILFLSFLEVSLPVHETHLMKRMRSEHNFAIRMASNIVMMIDLFPGPQASRVFYDRMVV